MKSSPRTINQLAEFCILRRNSLGYNRIYFSEKTGLSQGTLVTFEKATSSISYHNLIKILDALEIELILRTKESEEEVEDSDEPKTFLSSYKEVLVILNRASYQFKKMEAAVNHMKEMLEKAEINKE